MPRMTGATRVVVWVAAIGMMAAALAWVTHNLQVESSVKQENNEIASNRAKSSGDFSLDRKPLELPPSSIAKNPPLSPPSPRINYADISTQTPRQLWHKAAVSGDVRDWIIARDFEQRWCLSTPPLEITMRYQSVTENQRKAIERIRERCSDSSAMAPKPVIRSAPHVIQGDTAALFAAIRTGEGWTETLRQQMLPLLRSEGSASLLQAASGRLLSDGVLDALGLDTTGGVSAMDRILVDWVISIRACQEQGNCRDVADLRTTCTIRKDCVSDLADYPNRFIFGPIADRPQMGSPWQQMSPAEVEARWRRAEAAVDRLIGPPR